MDEAHDSSGILPVEAAERIVWNALELDELPRLSATALGRSALAAFVLDQQRRLWLRFAKQGVHLRVRRRPSDESAAASEPSPAPSTSPRWNRRADAILSTHRQGHPDYDRVLRVAVDALGLRGLCDPASERVYDSLAPSLSTQAAILRLTEIAEREHAAASLATAG